MSPAYDRLARRFAKLAAIEDSLAVLGWDTAAMMPEGGAEARAHQVAVLKGIAHATLTARGTEALLDKAAGEALGPWETANLALMRRRWAHAAAVPARLVEAFSKACSESEIVWRTARAKGDFAMARPHLERVLDLTRRIADAKAKGLGLSPYEALMDSFEPGLTRASLDRLFGQLEPALKALLPRVLEAQGPEPLPLPGPFPIARQAALGLRAMRLLGFDFEHGRLDVSAHPFCGGVPEDVRITTRYDEADFFRSLLSVLHETGHALYEQGLPREWRDQPVGQALGMALHESQSLIIEMQAGRSPAFLAFLAPLVAEELGVSGPAFGGANLVRLATRVRRSPIRVDADEVTYPLHVILRYRLETALIAGALAVKDLPQAWNEGMRDLVGVVPANDREGCLQDIHWYDGAFGYFPSYTLGAILAAQFFQAAVAAVPAIPTALGQGEFAPLLGWLRAKVHRRGAQISAEALVAQATGRALSPEPFLAHLERRYLGSAAP